MKKFNNFASPHCHINSLDSASTPEAFLQREIELGTGAITITDHGTMATCRDVYDLAKAKGVTPILGQEGYLRDDHCDILAAEGISGPAVKEYMKYAHFTVHHMDEASFRVGSKLLSRAYDRAERHGSEVKPLFDWRALEELGAQNTVLTSSCLAGVVQRHLLADRPDIAEKYYQRIRSLVKPGNFYVEMFPHKCDKYWVKGLFVELESGDKIKYWAGKKLRVEVDGVAKETTAEELAVWFTKKDRPVTRLLAQKDGQKWVDTDPVPVIKSAENVETFLQNDCRPWCPDGDVQLGANKYMLELAQKYGDKILISDDAHFVNSSDQSVQDIRLMAGGNTWRFYGNYRRLSSEEAWQHFSDTMGTSERQFEEWIENSREWAGKFKDFKFTARRSLPTRFYPTDTLGHLRKLIDKHGRMNWRDPKAVARLKSEINLLHHNGTVDLLPYFFVVEELCDVYLRNGRLTGPGRGSAAGLKLAELLGITHVDPLQYDLSQDRFMTLDRIQTGKLPDIDQDTPSRDLLEGQEERGYEVELEDGTKRMCRLDAKVATAAGVMSVKDAHALQLDILEWLP